MSEKQSTESQNQTQSNQPAFSQADIDAAVARALAKRDEEAKIQNDAAVAKAVEAAKPFKVKHKDEEYEFAGTEKENYIVRHSRTTKHESGAVTEDPGSVRVQIYRPEVYKDLMHEDEGKGKVSAFSQLGEKLIVIHDPSKTK